jgi:anaphase-promoting complex subunit 5
MPRFLTPVKICVLVLIDLYASEQIPTDRRLDVLSFTAEHIIPHSGHEEDAVKHRLSILTSDIASFSEILSKWQSGIPGRTIYDILLQRIWDVNDLDSLHSLFERVGDLVTPQSPETAEAAALKISRASPIGQFVRRCSVEFTRLQFADSQALWNALSSYRAPSYELWASRNPEAARRIDSELPSWAGAKSSQNPDLNQAAVFAGADDTETLLTASIHQLQKLGTRVPPSLQGQLRNFVSDLQESSSQSLQHFMAFFEHWRAAQYNMALESLHRYFDYSLALKGRDAGEGVKTYYQYALLHLSVLHADFERWEECADAMGECIATGMISAP